MFNALRAYTSLAFTKSKRSGELFAHYSDPRSRCIQFAIARFVLSLTLVLSIYATNTNVNTFPIVGGRGLALQIAALYGLSALASIWTLNYSKLVWRAILFTQLLIDFTLLPLLLSELGGGLSTYSILLFIPIAASATLFTWPATLGVAAISTLFLLSNAVWMQWFRDIAVDWIAVGLYGMGGFMMAALLRFTSDVADRAHNASQVSAALQRITDAIESQHTDMSGQALLVLDPQLSLVYWNTPAKALVTQAQISLALGDKLSQHAELSRWENICQNKLATSVAWPPTLADANTGEAGFGATALDARLVPQSASVDALHLKATPLRSAGNKDLSQYTLLALETQAQRATRVQNSNLAAIGRLSATVAHEIRNPLAAICQSAELIMESAPLSPADQKMLSVLLDNAMRIERTVHGLLGWAGGLRAQATVFNVLQETRRVSTEFLNRHALPDTLLSIQAVSNNLAEVLPKVLPDVLPDVLPEVLFDTDHFQQILNNLLDNGQRFCSRKPSALAIQLHVRRNNVLLLVLDDGLAMPAQMKAHLFEPFKTTGATARQGNGLGLFISREYAQANQGGLKFIEQADQSAESIEWIKAPYTKAFALVLPRAKPGLEAA